MTLTEKIKDKIEQLNGEVDYHENVLSVLNKLKLYIDIISAEQPSEDLEKFIQDLIKKYPVNKKLVPNNSLNDYYQGLRFGVLQGANWQKEKMLKSAIDGTVGEGNPQYPQWGEHLPTIAYSDMMLLPKDFKFGDKIKIIVIKEDFQDEK